MNPQQDLLVYILPRILPMIKQITLPLCSHLILIITPMISNSNWTEWSTVQGVIGRVILKSRAGLLSELYNMRFNY